MAIQEPIDTQDFLTSFKRFMDKAVFIMMIGH